MLLPVFQDLIKPQWRGVIETLKRRGGLPVSELAKETGVSYMAAKSHCEDLTKTGYLVRTRLPRSEVGRPEILYTLSTKADALFPRAGIDFTLELLEGVKRMFGESTPEKLLYQYFQRQQARWAAPLAKATTAAGRASKLAALRTKEGYASCFQPEQGQLQELHNPLQPIFEHYPRAATLELGLMEELLGTRVTRSEQDAGNGAPAMIVYQLG